MSNRPNVVLALVALLVVITAVAVIVGVQHHPHEARRSAAASMAQDTAGLETRRDESMRRDPGPYGSGV